MVKNPEDDYKYYEDDPDEFVKAWCHPVFIEKSDLYEKTGILADCDILYSRVNKNGITDIGDIKVLSKYLTDAELKERLVYENYMLLKTEQTVEDYINYKKNSIIRGEIFKLQKEVNRLRNLLIKGKINNEEQIIIDKLIESIKKR